MKVSVMVGFLPWQINFAMAKSIFAMKEELMVEIIVENGKNTGCCTTFHHFSII